MANSVFVLYCIWNGFVYSMGYVHTISSVVCIINDVNVIIKFIVPSDRCCDCLMGCIRGLLFKSDILGFFVFV